MRISQFFILGASVQRSFQKRFCFVYTRHHITLGSSGDTCLHQVQPRNKLSRGPFAKQANRANVTTAIAQQVPQLALYLLYIQNFPSGSWPSRFGGRMTTYSLSVTLQLTTRTRCELSMHRFPSASADLGLGLDDAPGAPWVMRIGLVFERRMKHSWPIMPNSSNGGFWAVLWNSFLPRFQDHCGEAFWTLQTFRIQWILPIIAVSSTFYGDSKTHTRI
ncbi:hypothetical protein CPC08DRAFT_222870 [Agrocybe pediades]|nr:hypothetical protein CPC08DRAFT_222870 [Agrocybe pediades]